MENKNYKDTADKAKDIRDIPPDKRRDGEFAYEVMAAAASMGLYSHEQELMELTGLELTRQALYDNYTGDN